MHYVESMEAAWTYHFARGGRVLSPDYDIVCPHVHTLFKVGMWVLFKFVVHILQLVPIEFTKQKCLHCINNSTMKHRQSLN